MIRTTRPTAGNKYFIRQANGGYSTCIQGKPTDSQCNVLSNCVGYACGAFNEELGLGYEKYHLNCNAENFIERAIASGLSVVSKPVVGSILCWEGVGSLAGHVAIVIEVINDNCIKTAESGYGSSNPFWISTRYNNNGRWGLNSNYKPRGFIVNPNYPYNPPKPTPTPKKSNEEIAREVIAGKWGNYPERKTRLEAAGYDYATIQGIVNEMLKPSPAPTPEPPKPSEGFKVGDYVVPTKLVDYKGTYLIQYDDKYQIIQKDSRGNVLGAVRGSQRPIWAVLPDENIKKVG